MLKNRLATARSHLESQKLDALLFTNMSNIRYLSGFTGSDAALLVFSDDACFLTDSRYSYQASKEVSDLHRIIYREKGPEIASVLSARFSKRVGFEAEAMTVAARDSLAELLPEAEFVPIGGELQSLRVRKDEEEVALLALSAEIASSALIGILDKIEPGKSERDIALELEFAMRKGGADNMAFDVIVASGERGALPHGKASSKIIRSGELVTIDFGGVCNGFNSDETVTVAVGEPDGRQRDIYMIVKDAHDLAIDSIKPGMTCKELDGKARNYIAAKGFGEYFGHGLGHGVGLDIHEKPSISFRSDAVIEEGMVFTVEPGIYIPGWGGVRIEDTVCVINDGCKVLTKVEKELMVL